MNKIIVATALAMQWLSIYAAEYKGQFANNAITWRWDLSSGKLASVLNNKISGTSLNINSECFQLVLGDGSTVKVSELKLVNAPRTVKLPAEPASPTAACQFAGRQVTLEFSDERDHFMASWQGAAAMPFPYPTTCSALFHAGL
jgi:hypothetical protein